MRTLDGSVYYWSLEQSNSPYFLVKFKRGWRYYSVYLKSGGWWSGKLLVLAHTWDLHPLSDVYLLPDEFKKNCPALKWLTSLEIDKKIGDPDYKFIAGYKGKKSPVVYINTDINFDEVVEKKEIPFEVFAYAEKLVTFTDKAIEEFTDLESKPEVKRQVEIEKKKENRDVLKGVLGLGFWLLEGIPHSRELGVGEVVKLQVIVLIFRNQVTNWMETWILMEMTVFLLRGAIMKMKRNIGSLKLKMQVIKWRNICIRLVKPLRTEMRERQRCLTNGRRRRRRLEIGVWNLPKVIEINCNSF